MTLKGEGKGPLPPLLAQYVELRERYPDYLLLFQVGDFYECFGEDAERLARTVDITLTHKTSTGFTTPMAGIPIRSADGYIERLLEQRIRVAVADQTEDAAVADGLVKREVTQLITPGTVTDDRLLKPDANYLAAVATGDGYGLALLDITTGEFCGAQLYSKRSLFDELGRYRPAEVLLAPELQRNQAFAEEVARHFAVMLSRVPFDLGATDARLCEHFGTRPTGADSEALVRAAGAVLSYAKETQQGHLAQVSRFLRYDPGAFMQLDEVALATLEVFQPALGGDPRRSLFYTLDETRTAPGRRLLRAWLRHPLLDEGLIGTRQDAVEVFVHDAVLRTSVRKTLYKMHDLERLAGRLASGRAVARDLAALARSLTLVPTLRTLLTEREERALVSMVERLGEHAEITERIGAALVDTPPIKLTEGGLIRDGFDSALDRTRAVAEEGRAWMAALEAKERAETGIGTLKVGFHSVFGYYLEVTRPYQDRVPQSYRVVQTLKDRQRYTRADLQEKEREVLRAEASARAREYEVFGELRASLTPFAEHVRELGATLAELDTYAALAEVAAQRHYVRPRFNQDGVMHVRGGRHPVVERHAAFIANDLHLSPHERLLVITGPNMSGKSTFLRQNALVALLAQIGSFVPAEEADLPLFDRLYTRIGAGDDIAGGRSTFMVEMSELARILQGATAKSLVLLDEVGRGTSTFDGLSLAWAASEHLHTCLGAYTLFATHYFELTELSSRLSAARNYHVAAREEAQGLTFYHQVLPGPASKAYGLEVASLAGVPASVLSRARQVLEGLEARGQERSETVVEALLALELNHLSPIEALRTLQRLQETARGLTLHETLPKR